MCITGPNPGILCLSPVFTVQTAKYNKADGTHKTSHKDKLQVKAEICFPDNPQICCLHIDVRAGVYPTGMLSPSASFLSPLCILGAQCLSCVQWFLFSACCAFQMYCPSSQMPLLTFLVVSSTQWHSDSCTFHMCSFK